MSQPTLSIIVIVYKMSRQARNTLLSLSPPYQRHADSDHYEIIVVENDSDDELGREAAESVAPNIRYFYRREPGISPGPAINFAFEQCRTPYVGLLIDGARMVTPRVVEYALMAWGIGPNVLVAVPGYTLGDAEQQRDPNYNEEVEQALLRGIEWPDDGYKLFAISRKSHASPKGSLQPLMECNCLFAARDSFAEIGYADERFDTMAGGGSVNLHIWRALGMLPETQLVILPCEGSFHQYHGGVTTRAYDGLDEEVARHKNFLHGLWYGGFRAVSREPIMLGSVDDAASAVLEDSARKGIERWERIMRFGYPEWPDDYLAEAGYGPPLPHRND